MKSLRFILPLAVFISLIVLFMNTLNRDTRYVPSPLIDKPAPDFSLPLLSDPNTVRSPKDLLGHPWIMNIWASWCAACRIEHPLFNQLAAQTDIMLVGMNYKDENPAAEQWLAQMGNPYQQIIVDAKGSAGLDWGVYGVPETFLIDAEGIIRYKHVGPITADTVRDIILPFFAQTGSVPSSSETGDK